MRPLGRSSGVGRPRAHRASRGATSKSKGVQIINPPEERPYGVEALIRDNTGNWLVLVEPRAFTQAEMEAYAGDDPSAMNPLP